MSEVVHEADCIATLSGGIDSTTMVHWLDAQGKRPLCVYLKYGSISEEAEIEKAKVTCKKLHLDLIELDFDIYKHIADSFILGNKTDYEDGTMFYLEGRNAVIGLLMAVMAKKYDVNEVYLGINYNDEGEDGEYPDTTSTFVMALNMLIQITFKHKVKIIAPWLDQQLDKPGVILLGEELGVNWVKQTHSCSNTSGKTPCLDYYECESCIERRRGFEIARMKDPFFKDKAYLASPIKTYED